MNLLHLARCTRSSFPLSDCNYYRWAGLTFDKAGTDLRPGLSQYTTSAHIGRATLEAMAYQTRAVVDIIEKETGEQLEMLQVDGEALCLICKLFR